MTSTFRAYSGVFSPCIDCSHFSFDDAVTCATNRLAEAFDAVIYENGEIIVRRAGFEDAIYDIQEFPWATQEEEMALLRDLFGDEPEVEG